MSDSQMAIGPLNSYEGRIVLDDDGAVAVPTVRLIGKLLVHPGNGHKG